MNKKGATGLEGMPSMVIIVCLVFLVLATMAFIALKYGQAMPSDNVATSINETLTTVDAFGEMVDNASLCNFKSFSITRITNSSGFILSAGNYTTSTSGIVYAAADSEVNGTDWLVTYTSKYAAKGCDVLTDFQTEIDNNTSIAGMVMTISLVAVILTVLLGAFVLNRNRGL